MFSRVLARSYGLLIGRCLATSADLGSHVRSGVLVVKGQAFGGLKSSDKANTLTAERVEQTTTSERKSVIVDAVLTALAIVLTGGQEIALRDRAQK